MLSIISAITLSGLVSLSGHTFNLEPPAQELRFDEYRPSKVDLTAKRNRQKPKKSRNRHHRSGHHH